VRSGGRERVREVETERGRRLRDGARSGVSMV
jgi:hypothetical protein